MSRGARRSAGESDPFVSESTPARRAIDEPSVTEPRVGLRLKPFAVGTGIVAAVLGAGMVLTSSTAATGLMVAQPGAATATYDSNVDTLSRGAINREAAVAYTTASVSASPTAPAPVVYYISSVAYLRAQANTSAKILATLAVGTKVTAVGDAANGWQPISTGSVTGFVKSALLTTTAKGTASAASTKGAASSAYPACASGSDVEAGLVAHTILVHRAVCTTYPSITSYSGIRGDGSEHASGHALDIMVSGSLGTDIAAWLKANYAALGITEIIYQQHIWTTQRASEGWRAMEDRGSATANHYDHIHVLTS